MQQHVLGIVAVLFLVSCTSTPSTPSGVKLGEDPVSRVDSDGRLELIPYRYSQGSLESQCTALIDTVQKELTHVLTASDPLFVFEKLMADFGDVGNKLTFMAYVSTAEAIRKEASACEEQISRFFVEVFTREDLYQAIKRTKIEGTENYEEKRLYVETLRSFEKNGLGIPPADREKLKTVLKEIASNETKFNANLNNDVSSVEFTEAELEGVPETVLARLQKGSAPGRYIVSTKRTIYAQVMENAKRDGTRRRLMLVYENRGGKVNVELLEKTIALRQQVAKLMNYATYADYKIDGRMAKNSKTAWAFLRDLEGKVKAKSNQDMARLLAFKKTLNLPGANSHVIEPWDILFLSAQLKKRDFSLDEEMIREYFPADHVVKAMFEIYSKLLGVTYEEVRDARVWHESVKLYRVRNASDGKLIAYFFADFFPRDGKYGHAAAFNLIQGRVLGTGEYNVPVASIVSNFNPPTKGKPSLMNHDEVETLFHEFGHIMHQTLTRAKFASLSGSSVYRDFVEAPSQMLEEWVWNPEMLDRISGHYLDTSKKLPTDLRAKLVSARDFNKGYFYVRQLYFGFLDMTYHTAKGKIDTTKVMNDLFKKIVGMKPLEGANFHGTFGHLMGGYDAGYYGYLWSEVYAADMFTRFESEGILNPKTGGDYRKSILEQGNARDPMELLKKFLGREPNSKAFFKHLGIR